MIVQLALSAVLLYVSTVTADTTWFNLTAAAAARTVPQNKTFLHLQLNLKPYSQLFEYFKARYKKVYNSDEENSLRRIIFEKNARFIEEHNYLYSKGLKSFTVAVNEFTDMTLEEFNENMKGFRVDLQRKSHDINQGNGATFLTPNNVDLSSRIDWREHGYVTGVKNQHHCGSCWAFSTTGSLEGQHFRKTGRLVSLSEQQLVDCTRDYHEAGCKGGIVDLAFQYIHERGGIESEKDYPYTALDGTCKFDAKKEVATLAGWANIWSGNETALLVAVATVGPVSIAIDASHPSFQFYNSGVYYEPKCSSIYLDHAVLVVGYGVEPYKYWLVKNSWGEAWGDNGYIKMSRDSNNQCGIATVATFPLV